LLQNLQNFAIGLTDILHVISSDLDVEIYDAFLWKVVLLDKKVFCSVKCRYFKICDEVCSLYDWWEKISGDNVLLAYDDL